MNAGQSSTLVGTVYGNDEISSFADALSLSFNIQTNGIYNDYDDDDYFKITSLSSVTFVNLSIDKTNHLTLYKKVNNNYYQMMWWLYHFYPVFY